VGESDGKNEKILSRVSTRNVLRRNLP